MSIVGLTKLRSTSNIVLKPLCLCPPVSTRYLYRSFCAPPTYTSVSGQTQSSPPPPEHVVKKGIHSGGVKNLIMISQNTQS
jgi:hypothetical protein